LRSKYRRKPIDPKIETSTDTSGEENETDNREYDVVMP